MVATDNTGRTTSPVNFGEPIKEKNADGETITRPNPQEPTISTTHNQPVDEQSLPAGGVRGGTTQPPIGVSGDVEQLDNDGNVLDVHPGEVARLGRDEGSTAAAAAAGNSDAKEQLSEVKEARTDQALEQARIPGDTKAAKKTTAKKAS